MIVRIFIAVMTTLGVISAGCALREESVQLEEVAYVTFVGDPGELRFQVDDGEPVALKDTHREVRYEAAPGRRRVRVWRGDELIVDRLIFLSRGQSFRVVLP